MQPHGSSSEAAPESLAANHFAFVWKHGEFRLDDLVLQSLMVRFGMIVQNQVSGGRGKDASPTRIIQSRHNSLKLRTNRSAYALRLGGGRRG
jgi:hypothetical protein